MIGLSAQITWNQRRFSSCRNGNCVDPVNSSGVITRANTTLIFLGDTSVPSTSPAAPPASEPSTSSTAANGRPESTQLTSSSTM